MTDVATLLDRCRDLGLEFILEGDRVRIRALEPPPESLLANLREHKAEIETLLRQRQEPARHLRPLCQHRAVWSEDLGRWMCPHRCPPQDLADRLEASLALGRRLKVGEIKALRCGLTGQVCIQCKGVPCLGSTPVGQEIAKDGGE